MAALAEILNEFRCLVKKEPPSELDGCLVQENTKPTLLSEIDGFVIQESFQPILENASTAPATTAKTQTPDPLSANQRENASTAPATTAATTESEPPDAGPTVTTIDADTAKPTGFSCKSTGAFYDAQEIVDGPDRKGKYQVKWVGSSELTWEPGENCLGPKVLLHCSGAVPYLPPVFCVFCFFLSSVCTSVHPHYPRL
jgi:hypothetical protein